MNKIYLDAKYDEYSMNANLISIALMDDTQAERTLYIENSDLVGVPAWTEGSFYAKNRILNTGAKQLPANVDGSYIAQSAIAPKITTWLMQYTDVEIYAKTQLSWMSLIKLYGILDTLPVAIKPNPIFLPSFLLAKGFKADTDINTFLTNIVGDTSVAPFNYNALTDVKKIKSCFEYLFKIKQVEDHRRFLGHEHREGKCFI
jgi:hypothetical protein